MSSKALFHVTVKGVIMNENRFLVLKKVKPSKDQFGYWELPGGGMEFDETPVEAMRREAKEETGLDIIVDNSISTFHVGKDERQIVGIIFCCHVLNPQVVLSSEHTEYRFVSQQEAKELLAPKIYHDIFGYTEND